MSDEVTLAQLATEMAQLRQQIEEVKQRLDMIYGAVTRLAESKSGGANPDPGDRPGEKVPPASSSITDRPLSATMMMDPGTMLDSLRQYAEEAGLEISPDTVDRLKADLPAGEIKNDSE